MPRHWVWRLSAAAVAVAAAAWLYFGESLAGTAGEVAIAGDEAALATYLPEHLGHRMPLGFATFRHYYMYMADMSVGPITFGGWQGASILAVCHQLDREGEYGPSDVPRCAIRVNNRAYGKFTSLKLGLAALALLTVLWVIKEAVMDERAHRREMRAMSRIAHVMGGRSIVVRKRRREGGEVPSRSRPQSRSRSRPGRPRQRAVSVDSSEVLSGTSYGSSRRSDGADGRSE